MPCPKANSSSRLPAWRRPPIKLNYIFVFTAVGRLGQDIQLQEIELYGPSGATLSIASASNPGGVLSTNGQLPSNLIDGDKSTRPSKWFDGGMSVLSATRRWCWSCRHLRS